MKEKCIFKNPKIAMVILVMALMIAGALNVYSASFAMMGYGKGYFSGYAARFKDVRRNEGHVFVLVPVFAKEAFPEPTAGDDEFFRIAFVCQGLDDGAASDDDVCPVA